MTCVKCGAEINGNHMYCRKCSKQSNQPTHNYYKELILTRNITIGIIIVIFIGIIWLFHACTTTSTGQPIDYSATNPDISAWTAATSVVQNDLKAPSTATFPWYDASYVTDNSDGTYDVSSYVDADNSFGAKIRSNWSCVVDSSGNVSDVVIDN